ncbi:hypothetical protein HY745_09645 [Candidatus Desantisbacteria bacterium]|nr:hypothetical protein [Candidatus Desantisbacteria bacterium]
MGEAFCMECNNCGYRSKMLDIGSGVLPVWGIQKSTPYVCYKCRKISTVNVIDLKKAIKYRDAVTEKGKKAFRYFIELTESVEKNIEILNRLVKEGEDQEENGFICHTCKNKVDLITPKKYKTCPRCQNKALKIDEDSLILWD